MPTISTLPDSNQLKVYKAIYTKTWLLSFIIVGLEISGSAISGSLSLLADVGHVILDTFLGIIPLFVALFSQRVQNYQTFTRVAGSIASMVLLIVGTHVMHEAIDDSYEPHTVQGWYLFIFSALAACVNVFQHRFLARVDMTHRHIAHEGLEFHIRLDLIKNSILPIIGVLIGLHMLAQKTDLWAAFVIGCLMIVRAILLFRQCLLHSIVP